MLNWIKRIGLLIIVVSSAVIIVSYAQWYFCQAKPLTLDSAGVGVKHCSYVTGGIEVIFLAVGYMLLIGSILIEKLIARKID